MVDRDLPPQLPDEPRMDDAGDVVSGDVVAGALYRQLQGELSEARQQIADLTIALDTNREIGAAVGIVMLQRLITREQAFDLLRTASQHQHRKLREVARDVVETGHLDPGDFDPGDFDPGDLVPSTATVDYGSRPDFPGRRTRHSLDVVVSKARTVIKLGGEFDFASARELDTVLLRFDSVPEPPHADLIDVTFLDTSGAAPLFEATRRRQAKRLAGPVIDRASPSAARLMALAGVAWHPVLDVQAWDRLAVRGRLAMRSVIVRSNPAACGP
jgi:anti-anti-sigma regulatory factor